MANSSVHYRLGDEWRPEVAVAAFDFDDTLVDRRRNKTTLALKSRQTLARLRARGYNLAIFSNHSGVNSDRKIGLIASFVDDLGISCDIFVATKHDQNRKPQIGMWELFRKLRQIPAGSEIPAASFYCGDAAGRAKDFSACDRWFAHNIGLQFSLPEEIHGDDAGGLAPELAAGGPWTEFDASINDAATDHARLAAQNAAAADRLAQCRAVILVGSPASGKSTFARQYLAPRGFRVLSRDPSPDEPGAKYLTKVQFRRRIAEALAEGSKVALDGTHRNRQARKEAASFINAAPTIGIAWMTTPRPLCHHLDGLRCHRGTAAKLLPCPVIPGYWKNFEPPSDEEGFACVGRVRFTCAPESDAARLRFGQ